MEAQRVAFEALQDDPVWCEDTEPEVAIDPAPVARAAELIGIASSVVQPFGLYADSGPEMVEEAFYRVMVVAAFLWAVYGVVMAFSG